MKKEKSEGKLKLTKEQEEEVIKKGVMAMTKIIERLEEENKKLKEIGKLLELLNEYSPEDFNWFEKDGKIYDRQEMYDEADVLVEMGVYIISKQFGFIKWLVENDKIDFGNIPPITLTKGGDETAYFEPVLLEDSVIMILSIQDEPISFLISLLK